MYHSYLLIDTGLHPDRPRPGRLWLRNLYRVHQRLCMAFPSDPAKRQDPYFLRPFDPALFPATQVHTPRGLHSGFLFRVDPLPGGRAMILVQSAIPPDWDYAFQNARFLLAAPPSMRRFDPDFSAGETLAFCLMANPTRKIETKSGPDGRRRNGRRVPVRPDALADWLHARAQPAGFHVLPDQLVIEPGYVWVHDGRPDSKPRRYRSARYHGRLQVLDPQAFHLALASGIGPAKAFGFGLLSAWRTP